ncbi:deoxycytidylate deaminase isoform X2 [Eurytemora carolleeae]|uniref:deoxycytidylate deaminase isoform X2 n=1 Tax=Eurytemora carolleeae TaxID=1294199 RepID=UPI000C7856DB|nr:deoxycytidylate deaminase isoform X2 [Eurytemora carolleeae]|eukprot:XP_023338450.1 deoxycytidylate deaminase-like isoform X2 [Eurytemora affinis]
MSSSEKSSLDIQVSMNALNMTEETNIDTSKNESPVLDPVTGSNNGREDYLDWNEYFMAVSFLSAQRSKDPATQVGACIVSTDKRIVGIGYNGFPRGCGDKHLPWGKRSSNELENKYMYVCHAEMNAIMNKNSASVEGCSMFVALFPCNECAKMIIQAGIKEVVFFSDKHCLKPSTIASKKLLDMAGVTYKQFIPRMRQLTIDFELADSSVYNDANSISKSMTRIHQQVNDANSSASQ